MANTYPQLNVHAVFAVKFREGLLSKSLREKLFPYMAGILKNDGSFPLAIGGWVDHVHVFFELNPNLAPADQIRMLKATSSKWINTQGFLPGRFAWQSGYGAFSHTRNERKNVISYIENQESHHREKSFKEEYRDLLTAHEIDFNKKYLFEFFETN